MNLLFDRNSLHFVGQGRESLPFEVEVKDVEVKSLSKQVSYREAVDVFDEEGKALYFLPQAPLVEKKYEVTKIETIEKTSEPVIHMETKKVPLLGEDGKQVSYEVIETLVTPAVLDEEGNVIEEEKTEEVPTGRFILCYTTEEVESQKEDSEGRKLFYKTVEEEVEVTTPQETLIIDETDERFVEGLERVTNEVENTKTVTFEESPQEFTYEDIIQYKYLNLVNESQLDELIVEVFTNESSIDLSYENHSGNTGFGFVNLPPSGKVKTVSYPLSSPQKVFNLLEFDGDEGIEIRYGNRLITKESPLVLTSPVDKISFILTNKADTPKDVRSFAVGY
jgi:hypothetical protein